MNDENIRRLESVSVHYVRNKVNGEGLVLSENPLNLEPELNVLLKNFFLTPFKSEIYYQFFDEDAIENNAVYSIVGKIFDHPQYIHEESKNLAEYLHDKTLHSDIKDGEFYVTYFKDYVVEGKIVDAIGLFKTEDKETFLKVPYNGESFEIVPDQGISLKKLNRGCLIFNTEKENGYMISAFDTTKGGAEAQYWMDDFLKVQQRKDEYFETEYTLSVYKDYITQKLPEEYEISKADQADLLNKSINFFKEKESFDLDEFQQQVIGSPEVIESFESYKKEYEEDRDIKLADKFEIAPAAVKKQQRYFKSVIKLDKNFHIYVHGDRKRIEMGEDDKGKYYRLYFDEEK